MCENIHRGASVTATLDTLTGLRDSDAQAWVEDRFPGASDLRDARLNNGGAGIRETQVFTYQGLTLELSRYRRYESPTGVDNSAHVVALCGRCDCFTWVGTSVASAEELHLTIKESVVAKSIDGVETCFACKWVLDAQAHARRATSRFARWRFKVTRGATVEDILSR